MIEIEAFTRRRLEVIVERALARAGVLGHLPTPLEEVRRAAGVAGCEDLARLPAGLTGRQSLLGAFWFERRMMYVDLAQPEPRRRFTEAHEMIHALCPWHETVLREDTADELSGRTRAVIEAEANVGAALLLFQGARFAAATAAAPCTFAAGRELAALHGTSLRATLRQLVEHHRAPAALIVVGRFPRSDGSLPIWSSAHSAGFRPRYGSVGALLPGGVEDASPLRELLEAARRSSTPAGAAIPLRAGAGCWHVEAHYNRRTFLVLASAPSHAARRAA